MPSRARTVLSLMIAVLVVLEASPSLPHRPSKRPARGECEIAATVQPVALVAVPAERGAAPVDASTFERSALGTFMLVTALVPAIDASAAALRRIEVRGGEGGTFVRELQQRARSPGDPDPL